MKKFSCLFSFFLTFAISAMFLAGCTGRKVERLKIEQTVDLSGRWNDTDSRLVSEEIIKDCLSSTWLDEFTKTANRLPVVILGPATNLSHEHINMEALLKNLQRALINSQKVTFVVSSDERSAVREEREDQQKGLTDPATVKPIGKEIGADFLLRVSINTLKDEIKGKYVILYQVNVELIDLTTNSIKWFGQTELKKLITKTRYSF